MANTVSTTEFEPYSGKPDKERLIATYRGEKTDRVPNFEVLIEDKHVPKMLGRKASNTLSADGDPAKGADDSEDGIRPMYPSDYIEVCNVIGQDCILLESLWTPLKQKNKDGSVSSFFDKSFKSREDLDRIVWPGEEDINRALGFVKEYVAAVKGTGIGVVYLGGCIFQTLYEFVIGFQDFMILLILMVLLVMVHISRLIGYLLPKFQTYGEMGRIVCFYL